jgi:DNA-binding LacI/PurR family transcriptional regulator
MQLGHTTFAMIHTFGVPAARARSEHLRKYLAERTVPDDDSSLVLWSFAKLNECESLVAKMLGGSNSPTALIAGAHQYRPEVLSGIRKAEMRIPNDVSLVSFGDSRGAEVASPAISVIAADQVQHAVDTTAMLLRILDGDESAPRSISSTSRFIQRESCGPPTTRRRP